LYERWSQSIWCSWKSKVKHSLNSGKFRLSLEVHLHEWSYEGYFHLITSIVSFVYGNILISNTTRPFETKLGSNVHLIVLYSVCLFRSEIKDSRHHILTATIVILVPDLYSYYVLFQQIKGLRVFQNSN
jgi:hypothetical protein